MNIFRGGTIEKNLQLFFSFIGNIGEREKKSVKDNWLGNVNVVVSDKKLQVDDNGDGVVDYYKADIKSVTDMYPGGMIMPNRNFNPSEYRFGMNGQEKVNEITPEHYTALFWEYDPRTIRRWNPDPKPDASISLYNCFAGNPVWLSDHFGDTTNYYNSETGKSLGSLMGGQGLNDRTINGSEYNRLMNERYLMNNIITGESNFYMKDPTKTPDDFLNVNEMENFLNNSENIASSVVGLNSDVGLLARIGFAEMRGQNATEQAAAMDITLNRVSTGGRPNTLEGMITQPGAYSSLNEGDPNRPFFNNPYAQIRTSSANYVAWTSVMSSALAVNNGSIRGISGGATLYYSPMSMNPPGSQPSTWNFNLLNEVYIQRVRTNHMRSFIEQ